MAILAAPTNSEAIFSHGAPETPNGFREVGYTMAEIAGLVEVATRHRRPLVICPKQVMDLDIAQIFGRPRKLR